MRPRNVRSRGVLAVAGFACALSTLFLTPRGVRADDWETYQHDTAHTGRTASSPNPTALYLDWSAPTGYATPVIVGNSVIGTKNGGGASSTTISSFDVKTGAINWSYTGSYAFPSQAAYGNGLVAFTTGFGGNLNVLSATTGSLQYSVASTVNANMPLLVPQSNGSTVAYLANNNKVQAVALGATSGSILWTANGDYGGASIPTLVGGNTLIVAGVGQYWAIDTATGAQNHFKGGIITGGGGDTVVYDASRSQFYVRDMYDSGATTLTAYHFGGSYDQITQLWQRTGSGIAVGGQVALDANGHLYSADETTLVELDPATGDILRSTSGSFARGIDPLIAGNDLWIQSNTNTLAYDLNTLNVLQTLPGTRGSLNTAFDSPGAVDDNHFILDYGVLVGRPGFDVYATPAADPVPEPATASLLLVAAFGLLRRRRRE